MNKAGAGGILVDQTTWEGANEMSGNVHFDFVADDQKVDGLGGVTAFRPTLHSKVSETEDSNTCEKDTILNTIVFGRQTEAQRLRRIIYDLKGQRGGGLMLLGNKGCGKTALVAVLKKTALNFGMTVLNYASKKEEDERAKTGKVYTPLPLPKRAENELIHQFDVTLGEKLHNNTASTPKIYAIWHAIVQRVLVMGAKHKACSPVEWCLTALMNWKKGVRTLL